jgi:hypothetical protein
MKPKTYHEGSQDERKAVRAYLKREVAKAVRTRSLDTTEALYETLEWINARIKRYRKRKGGL